MITWIASYPKSGNTWFRLLLNGYFTGNVDINNLGFCLSDQERYFYNSLCPRPGLTQSEVNLLRPAALMHTVAAVPQRPLFMKTHHANCYLDDIAAIPPTVTNAAVYMIRDPRDVVLSNARHFGLSIDDSITTLGDKTRAIGDDDAFIHCLGDWSTHVSSWTSAKSSFPVFGVKYESLKSDPEGTLTKILTKLELDVDGEKVNKAVELADFSRVQAQEAKVGFREKPKQCSTFFGTGKSTWKDMLTESQINKIEKQHGAEMVKHGYETVTL